MDGQGLPLVLREREFVGKGDEAGQCGGCGKAAARPGILMTSVERDVGRLEASWLGATNRGDFEGQTGLRKERHAEEDREEQAVHARKTPETGKKLEAPRRN